MGVSHEIMPMAASGILPFVAAGPAAIATLGAAAQSFRIVPRSEKGVVIRSGQPLLKPNVLELILHQISEDVPNMGVSDLLSTASLIQGPDFQVMPDMNVEQVLDGTDYHGLSGRDIKKLNRLRDDGLSRKDVKKNEDLKKRIEEKVEELPDHIREKGIYRIRSGLVWLRPFVDHVEKINVTNQTTPLSPFEIESSDGQYIVTAGITWNVKPDGDNPYKAIFKINNEKDAKTKIKTQELEQTVSWIVGSAFGEALCGKSGAELISLDGKDATKETRKICEKDLNDFGVDLTDIWPMPGVRVPFQILADALSGEPDPARRAVIAAAATMTRDRRNNIVSIVPDKPA